MSEFERITRDRSCAAEAEFIGGYLWFRGFRVIESSVHQPRYKRVGEHGRWKHTILDEQEWLARPDLWGIELYPQPIRTRKANLARFYSVTWYRNRFLKCTTCDRLCELLITESGFAPELLVANPEVTNSPCDCGAAGIRGQCAHFIRSITTGTELLNRVLDELYCLKDLALLDMHRSVGEDTLQTFRREAADYGAWLSLELIGLNPFCPVAFDPQWRTSTVVSLATQMYESRDFSIMPILADALQDAGCEHDDILTHCRGNGLHVRGCWVVDRVLGKE